MIIKLFCINGFTRNTLRNKLEEAIASNHLSCQVEEIHNCDDFTNEGIFSAPAIKIGDKVMLYDEHSPDEAVKKVINYLLTGCDGNLLVPVDFTFESIHALRYAILIASQLGKGITIAYIHQPIVYAVSYSTSYVDVIERSRKQLERLVTQARLEMNRSGNHIPVDMHFDIGEITSTLIRLVEDDKYDMIVMSSHAENTFLKRVLGSVSTLVGRLSPKPVIVVPPGVNLELPKKMVVGLTKELLNENAMKYLVDFASDQEVFVDFVFVTNDTSEFNMLKDSLTDHLLVHNKKFRKFSISSVPYTDDRIDEALIQYAFGTHAGMIAVTTHHRSFIESLGYRSVSKHILLKHVLPVMVLHSPHNAIPTMTDYLYDTIKEG